MYPDGSRADRARAVDGDRHDPHERRQRKTHLPPLGDLQRAEEPAAAPFDSAEAACRPEGRPVPGVRVRAGRVVLGELPGEQPGTVPGRHHPVPGPRMQRDDVHPQHVAGLGTAYEHRPGHQMRAVHPEPVRNPGGGDHPGVVEDLGRRNTETAEEGVRVTSLIVEDSLLADRVDSGRGPRLHAQHGSGVGGRQPPPQDRLRGRRQVVPAVHLALAGL